MLSGFSFLWPEENTQFKILSDIFLVNMHSAFEQFFEEFLACNFAPNEEKKWLHVASDRRLLKASKKDRTEGH